MLIGLLPRLWKSGAGFATLEDEAAIWADDIAREVQDATLRDAALHYLRELPSTQGEQVLVHQDLHGENVLAAQREPWLVIDPKPLAGEREFSVAPIVRSFELGHSKRDVLHRLDRLTAELGLDRDRALGWTVAQTVAWSGGSDYWDVHIDTPCAGSWRTRDRPRRPLRRRLHAREAGPRSSGPRATCAPVCGTG